MDKQQIPDHPILAKIDAAHAAILALGDASLECDALGVSNLYRISESIAVAQNCISRVAVRVRMALDAAVAADGRA